MSPSYQSWLPGMAYTVGLSAAVHGSAARHGPTRRFSYASLLAAG